MPAQTYRSSQSNDLVMAFCLAAWSARQNIPLGRDSEPQA